LKYWWLMAKNFRYLITIKNQSHEKYLYRNRVPNGNCAADISTAVTHREQKSQTLYCAPSGGY